MSDGGPEQHDHLPTDRNHVRCSRRKVTATIVATTDERYVTVLAIELPSSSMERKFHMNASPLPKIPRARIPKTALEERSWWLRPSIRNIGRSVAAPRSCARVIHSSRKTIVMKKSGVSGTRALMMLARIDVSASRQRRRGRRAAR